MPATSVAGFSRSLRAAAEALVAARDGATDQETRLAAIVDTAAGHEARGGARAAQQPDGTTIAQIMEATSWALHTGHGFLGTSIDSCRPDFPAHRRVSLPSSSRG